MSKLKVSIVVPIYNVADYLRRGVDSVLSQSFQDFELILVDDGSTDASGKICDEKAAVDNRIRVVHKENGGVSSARNLGLEHASGEWVYFMDPDDELLPDGLSTLVNGISDEVDAVMGGYEEIKLNGERLRKFEVQSEGTILDRTTSLRPLFMPYSLVFGYVGHVWLRLYRMEVIKEQHIRFDSTIAYREGTLFVADYLCHSRGTTYYIQKPIYRYYHREGSAVMSLKDGLSKKYLTGFDSSIKVLQSIKAVYPSFHSEIVRCAKDEVMDRYRKIKRMLLKFGVKDEELLRTYRHRCVSELDVPFIIAYLFKWSRKKYGKRIKNRLKGVFHENQG